MKRPETNLGRLRGHDADQFRRFADLPLWGFCNFHTITLYKRAEQLDQAVILPTIVLDPATSDTQAERLIRRHDAAPFLAILETLALATPRAPRNAPEVAEELAHAARLVRSVVRAQCQSGAPPALASVRAEFRDTLFAHPAAAATPEPRTSCSPMPSPRPSHSACCWRTRRAGPTSTAMRTDRSRSASIPCCARPCGH